MSHDRYFGDLHSKLGLLNFSFLNAFVLYKLHVYECRQQKCNIFLFILGAAILSGASIPILSQVMMLIITEYTW